MILLNSPQTKIWQIDNIYVNHCGICDCKKKQHALTDFSVLVFRIQKH